MINTSITKNKIDISKIGKVAVLMGGRSAEREISLLSGQGVLGALRGLGVDAHAFDPAEQDLNELKIRGVSRCFIALHGRLGEDGCVQGALEMLGIPYTGSGVLACAVAMDKIFTKRLWLSVNLPVPREYVLTKSNVEYLLNSGATQSNSVINLNDIATLLGLPLIVKPSLEGSSLGVSKVLHVNQILQAVRIAAQCDIQPVLCEEFIEGEEVTCALLETDNGVHALPVIRIQAPDGDYGYENKYFSDSVRYFCPSGLTPDEERNVQNLALEAWHALGCRGWARVDAIIRACDRKPFLLEMNASPGMTSHSLVPRSARVVGIEYDQLCLQVLASARLDCDNINFKGKNTVSADVSLRSGAK